MDGAAPEHCAAANILHTVGSQALCMQSAAPAPPLTSGMEHAWLSLSCKQLLSMSWLQICAGAPSDAEQAAGFMCLH